MSGFPQPPREVSPDGREIWGWAAALSAERHRVSRIRELQSGMRDLRTQCGSCSFWMTNQCPYERNVNGRKKGPSMKNPVCGKFAMKASAQALLAKLGDELKALATPLNDGEGLS